MSDSTVQVDRHVQSAALNADRKEIPDIRNRAARHPRVPLVHDNASKLALGSSREIVRREH
jgi:hypothetical protein